MNHFPLARRPSRLKAFTLIEVVVSVLILVLLSGALFALLTSVIESRETMNDRIRRENRLAAWDDFLRSTLQTLPRSSTIAAFDDDGGFLSIRFINAPFRIGPYAEYKNDSAFIIKIRREDEKKALAVDLVAYPSLDTTGTLATDYPPVPLLTDVQEILFEFYDPATKEWTEEWTGKPTKPHAVRNLVELTTGETREILIWIPHV